MSNKRILAAVAGLALTVPGLAHARSGPEPRAFDVAPMADGELDRARGGYFLSPLSNDTVRVMALDQARGDFLATGSVGVLVMDNWWSENGAALIAVSQLSTR